MSGLIEIQTGASVATLLGAWNSFTTALKNASTNNGSMDDVVTAATNLASAVTAFLY